MNFVKCRNYKGLRAIITGGSSGIGLEFARQLVAEGCSVCVISNDKDGLEDAVKAIRESCVDNEVKVHSMWCDLSRQDACRLLVDWIEKNEFIPDVFVNNAGIFDFKRVTHLSQSRLNLYINLHVGAVTHLSATIGEMMANRGRGMILNMSSMSCWMPMPGIAMYSATKSYIRVFSRSLNLELRDRGVNVMVACPGGIATSLFGLSPRLLRVGVAVGVLSTPQRFVKNALKRLRRGKSQYFNNLLNRFAIFIVGCLPNRLRLIVKHKLLDRLDP